MARFIQADRSQPFLLPPDLREWVPVDDLVHFIVEAVDRVDLAAFKINHRGSGSEQYHPRMMLALIVYCYANGIFSSRKIERATYFDVRVRFVAANTHPDHDTIAAFRRENEAAFSAAFLKILELATELKLLKVGTISVDGTKINANANIHKSIRYDRAVELREQLKLEISELMAKAKTADAAGQPEDQKLPAEIARRQDLHAKLDAACARLESAARTRAEAERADYEKRKQDHNDRGGSGRSPKAPSDVPRPEDQTNMTDPESRIMRKNKRSEYRQAYNAQAAVDADGSQLILANTVVQCASDANELVPMVNMVENNCGKPECVLADTGYANGAAVVDLERRKIEPLIATRGSDNRRTHDFRPIPAEKPTQKVKSEWVVKMQEKMSDVIAKARYAKRKSTVEPVFGIVKQAMGFRQFLLRGIDKVRIEFNLVALAYNCRRLHALAL
jgi:transposase